MAKTKVREAKDSLFSGGNLSLLIAGISAVLLTVGKGSAFNDLQKWLGWEGWYWRWAALLIGLIGVVFAQSLSKSRKLALQKDRDHNLESGGEFVLYLRPFFSDSKVFLPNPFSSVFSSGMESESAIIGPEEFVGRVLEPYLNVRQVGGDKATIGNARAYVADDAWQNLVKIWVSKASIIVIMPIVFEDKKENKIRGAATMWELEYLVQSGRLNRTIVIMPNSVPFRLKGSFNHEIAWERTREVATTFDLLLPRYDNKGAMMTFMCKEGLWLVKDYFPGKSGKSMDRKQLAIGLVNACEVLRNTLSITTRKL